MAEIDAKTPGGVAKDAAPPGRISAARGRSSAHRAGQLFTYGGLLGLSLVFLLPFLWMVSASFKTFETVFEFPPTLVPREYVVVDDGGRKLKVATYTAPGSGPQRAYVLERRPGEYRIELPDGAQRVAMIVPQETVEFSRPVSFRWRNYVDAWTAKPFTRYTLNTLFITLLCILGQVLSASLTAFAFARLRFPGRTPLFLLVLATMMLPAHVTMIPVYLTFRNLGWIDTFLPLIVPSFFGGGAFYIFLFRQFFMTLPKELDESARLDGCSSVRVYWNILMPLCKPIVATVAVFTFIGHWNEFMGPLIYLNSPENMTLALGLRVFQGSYASHMHLLMAAATVALLPILIVFFFAQKQFVQSVVVTGIKG